MADYLEKLHSSFISGNTEELSGLCRTTLKEVPGDVSTLAYQAYARCAEILRVYKKDAGELLSQSNEKATHWLVSKVFLGKNDFFSDSIHDTYFSDIEKAIDAFKASLQNLPEEDPIRSELAESFVRLLLEPTSKEMKDMRFLLSADDTFAMRLLPFISKDGLKALAEDYLSFYPKKKNRLPNQENLLNEMNKLSK